MMLMQGTHEPAAEQCGQFPEAGIHQTYKQWCKGKRTTSKPRTAAAGGASDCLKTFHFLTLFCS